MNLLNLALRLGKTIKEIERISMDEYMEWVAYFNLLDEQDQEKK